MMKWLKDTIIAWRAWRYHTLLKQIRSLKRERDHLLDEIQELTEPRLIIAPDLKEIELM